MIAAAPNSDAVNSAFETLKRYDGKAEFFKALEAVRCLDYIFTTALLPWLAEIRRVMSCIPGAAAKRDQVKALLPEIEIRLRNWGYIS